MEANMIHYVYNKPYKCGKCNCEHYQCRCQNMDQNGQPVCNDAGQYDCSFIRNSCNGAFHYATPGCGPGSLYV